MLDGGTSPLACNADIPRFASHDTCVHVALHLLLSRPIARSEFAAVLLQVTVELKNDLAIKGTLHSVDQYLNIKLNNIRVVNEQKYPHLVRTISSTLSTDVRLPGLMRA